jgi:hypothetical protein
MQQIWHSFTTVRSAKVEPDITIIGGGLSAIYAYWGCIDAGYNPDQIEVLANKMALPIGAIFLYESPIPWVATPITSILLGTADLYSINQWTKIVPTSAHTRFTNSQKTVTDYLYMYEEMATVLWGMMPGLRNSAPISPVDLEQLKDIRKAVICTFPNPNIKQGYAEKGYLINFPIYINKVETDKHVVIYNGLNTIPWVRQTMVPGHQYTEYPNHAFGATIMAYEKSRGNENGDVYFAPDLMPNTPPLTWGERREDNLLRVGRLAVFQTGYLSHQARKETQKFLMGLS